MTLFDVFTKRETGNDLLKQTSDEDLLAWTKDLQLPKRRRQLVATPLK